MVVELGAFALILALALSVLSLALTTAGRLRLSPVLAGAGGGEAASDELWGCFWRSTLPGYPDAIDRDQG